MDSCSTLRNWIALLRCPPGEKDLIYIYLKKFRATTTIGWRVLEETCICWHLDEVSDWFRSFGMRNNRISLIGFAMSEYCDSRIWFSGTEL